MPVLTAVSSLLMLSLVFGCCSCGTKRFKTFSLC